MQLLSTNFRLCCLFFCDVDFVSRFEDGVKQHESDINTLADEQDESAVQLGPSGLMRSSQTNKVFCTWGEAVASERRAGSGGQGGFCSVVFVTNDSASELEGANNPEWFTSRCQSGTDWWDSVATVYWNLSKNTDPEAPKPKYPTIRR